jgi:PAS domain S-box-containing protein
VLQFDDIADRRALERELRADADRLADFVAAAATITWELDVELRFSAADGDVPDDLVGVAWTDFADALNLDPGGAIAGALSNCDAWRTDVTWPSPGGQQRIVLSAVPQFGPDGAFTGYRGIGAPLAAGAPDTAAPDVDGTAPAGDAGVEPNDAAVNLSDEDKAAFRQIGETLINGNVSSDEAEPQRTFDKPGRAGPSDDDLRTILDTATDGVLTLDHRGRIASLNASAQAIFGYDTQEAVGRPIFDFLTAESATTVRDYLSALSDSGLARIFNDGREIVAVEKQGGEIPLFVTIGRIYAGGSRRGGKTSYCAVIRDITQWKRTEVELRSAKDQAERANAQKSEFLANISHELRTPLNAIIGFSEVMKTEKFGAISNDRYRGYVTDIHSSGEHLLSLINDLLDLSKVEAGKLELNFTSVDLSDIVQQCIGIIQEHATRERIIIRTSVADGLPNVVADQRSMRQILLNLLSNAVKFTEKGGQVIVSAVMDEDGQVKLLVKDTGVGMSADELVQAMEPFQRVERTQRSEKPGTGLGLPLTKALAEANRASFEIESEPGKGTRIQITFPTTRVLAD